ncbi:MAG: hypothetical protein K2U26_12930, partial [Cyclobacteriaceae bacterium]|nr:hypothetical protein [Cyclobacteriaceae bacterium]
QYCLQGDDLLQYYQSINAQRDYAARFDLATLPKKEYHSDFYFADGAVFAFTNEPIADEHSKIFKRFAGVFGQTYRRYLDLQKAEAQAREAQIEASLERVRSKTMAMHNSEDVSGAIATLFTELDRQGIENVRCGIAIIDINKTMDVWSVTNVEENRPDGSVGKMVKAAGTLDMNAHTLWQLIYEGWRNKTGYLYYHLSGKDKQKYIDLLNTAPGYLSQPLRELPDMHCQIYFFNEGAIWAYSLQPHTEQQQPVMKRFISVFSQTYLRYRDLQKAEVQAREAEIELGLERVRARAMAMQKSNELSDLVDTVFKELTKLDFALNWCIINIIDEPSLTNMVWAANPETNKPPESYLMKFEDYPFHHSMLKAYQERKTKHVYVIEGKEKTTYDRYLFNETEWRRVPKAAQDASRAMKRYVATFTFSNFGGLQTVGEEYLSDQNLDILSRFGKVFDLTYTRFNDLQKAEAQAYEAKIEASLERVRSRSMAMQKSAELGEVKQLVFEQFQKLNIKVDGFSLLLDFGESKDWKIWAAAQVGSYKDVLHIPYIDNPAFNTLIDTYNAGLDFHTGRISFEEKKQLFEHFFRYSGDVPEERKKYIFSTEGMSASTYFLKNSVLRMHNLTLTPYTATENEVLRRIAYVFDQSYTRFLDLQKAEAQAREAQIEAALERVRAKTMAMHKSEQLPETAQVLFEQFAELGKIPDRISIGIIKEESQLIEWWATDQMGSQLALHFDASIHGPTIGQYFTAWKEGKESIMVDLSGEALQEWVAYVRDVVKMPIDDSKIKGRRVHHGAFFSQGLLLISAHEPMPSETLRLLVRFAKVFSQTYTRFLDLQKAEANAREATIEAALEKVRGKAMAMQNSNDISTTIDVIFSELQKLGIKSFRSGVGLITKGSRKIKYYSAGNYSHSIESNVQLVLESELDGHEVLSKIYDSWIKQEDYFPLLKGEQLTSFYKKLNVNIPDQFIKNVNFESYGYALQFPEGTFYGWSEKPFTEAEVKILQRFKTIVALTFRRYL